RELILEVRESIAVVFLGMVFLCAVFVRLAAFVRDDGAILDFDDTVRVIGNVLVVRDQNDGVPLVVEGL
ncbi:MAG: hypothetical protein KIG22_02960, partial [Oxalobacter sp.]|nr:hypothetical protein [Oxalobacter sp.]